MNTPIALNAKICFTGAPASGLEDLAAGLHKVAEATTGGDIPFFNQTVWTDPESVLFQGGLEKVRRLLLVAEGFLGVHGPKLQEHGFYLLRGPLDVVALARMLNIPLPSEFGKTCTRLLEQVRLVVFQLPDLDGWRWQGFDQRRVAWLRAYTHCLFQVAREYGLKLDQLRVLLPLRASANADVSEASWRIFGVRLNPLKPSDQRKPLASTLRAYQAECRELFEAPDGSILGAPLALGA